MRRSGAGKEQRRRRSKARSERKSVRLVSTRFRPSFQPLLLAAVAAALQVVSVASVRRPAGCCSVAPPRKKQRVSSFDESGTSAVSVPKNRGSSYRLRVQGTALRLRLRPLRVHTCVCHFYTLFSLPPPRQPPRPRKV